MSYVSMAKAPNSEKTILATVDAVQRLKLFNANGSDWDKITSYFVIGVKADGVSITSWSYTPTTGILKIIGGANPNTRNISVTYRFFFSNTPLIAPYDLSTGSQVEWQPFISSVGSVGQTLDEESLGIVLESQSSIKLINKGYFDFIFDTLIWENQSAKIYSYFPIAPITEAVQLFDGVVNTKSYSDSDITFNLNDFVFKLQNTLNLGLFSNSDGSLLPALIGSPKRRIYGQVDNVKCASLTATLGGYALTGTFSGTLATKTLIGVGTLCTSELSPNDEIIIVIDGVTYKYGIDAIASNTSITLSKEIELEIVSKSATNNPKLPYRQKNRTWQIAGHKLRNPSTIISFVTSTNRFTVGSTLDFFAGDSILVNGISVIIARIINSDIVTLTSVTPSPSTGNTIEKLPIQKVFFNEKELFINRDYTIYNNSVASNVIFNSLAEFNITNEKSFGFNLVFTNGSTTVSTTTITDLKTVLKPRDWIRSDLTTETTWYEILDVQPQAITLRTTFGGISATKEARYKSVDYMDENSLITVNCLGMEHNSTWMKTASDCVRHLILNDAGFSVVNEATFSQAKTDNSSIISMVLPSDLAGTIPKIREVISQINDSVFGSLYGNSSSNISFSVLNTAKPQVQTVITDSDILSFSVNSRQKIINSIVSNYRPYVDVYSGENTTKTITNSSSFVDKYIGITNKVEKTFYLYEDDKVDMVSKRTMLYNSLSFASVTIKGKLNLASYIVNDKIYLSLDRLYSRYGGVQKEKLGTVTSVKVDGYNTELVISDIGNLYNRVMSFAPSATSAYTSASNDVKLKYGFIVSALTETPDITSEVGLGSNIIG